jgi:hypothetical protein
VDADLQHDAARHAGGLIAPRRQVDLAQPVAADVGFGVDELAEVAIVDLLLDPAEMALAAALIAERENDAGAAAGLGDGAAVGDVVGDRLVEEHVLARLGGSAGSGEMHVVRRGVDDGFDLRVGQHLFVARGGFAAVFLGEGGALVLRSGVTSGDFDLAGALDGIGQHVRPPAHADAGDPERLRHGNPRIWRSISPPSS